jgi:hypothetical protein
MFASTMPVAGALLFSVLTLTESAGYNTLYEALLNLSRGPPSMAPARTTRLHSILALTESRCYCGSNAFRTPGCRLDFRHQADIFV